MRLSKLHQYIFWFPCYVKFALKGHRRCFSISTRLTVIERLLLYKLGLSLKHSPTIVEVGSYLGASSTFLATVAKEKSGRLYCVDTWENDADKGGFKDTYSDFIENTKCYKNWITPLRGKSVEIAEKFDKNIDLLFIDADHSYEGVKADIVAWFPKLKQEAIIIFHDYIWYVGVRKAVDEMINVKPEGKRYIIENIYWTKTDDLFIESTK